MADTSYNFASAAYMHSRPFCQSEEKAAVTIIGFGEESTNECSTGKGGLHALTS